MINANIPIWVCSTPVDMRKGFDSLAEHVRAFLGRDPLTDGMFVFRGRSGHLLKILWSDRTGAILYYKRLHTEHAKRDTPAYEHANRRGTPLLTVDDLSCSGANPL